MSGCDPAFSALVGNRSLKEQLTTQAAGRGLSHAYLISGAAGMGKKTLAGLLAAAYVCSDPGKKPCGHCPGCRKAMSGIHPDVIRVGEEDRDVTVSMVRQLRADAYIRPNEADRKVYIIPSAQRMNASAQNAILKLLEDGPAYAAFLLLCENPAALLPTIRSRCEQLALSPVTPEEAESVLQERFPHESPERIRAAADNCGGAIGCAVQALEGSDSTQINEAAARLVALMADFDELDLAQFCLTMEKWDRDTLTSLFTRLSLLLRHALAIQAGAGATVDEGARADAAPGAALPRRSLLEAAALLDRLRNAAVFNVGVGHLCGALCAGLSKAVC